MMAPELWRETDLLYTCCATWIRRNEIHSAIVCVRRLSSVPIIYIDTQQAFKHMPTYARYCHPQRDHQYAEVCEFPGVVLLTTAVLSFITWCGITHLNSLTRRNECATSMLKGSDNRYQHRRRQAWLWLLPKQTYQLYKHRV
ncbi:hypothetical protein BDV11DRAFT_93362 [Aspergillus similis]